MTNSLIDSLSLNGRTPMLPAPAPGSGPYMMRPEPTQTFLYGVQLPYGVFSLVQSEPTTGARNVPVYRLSALCDGGMTVDQIMEDFPSLTRKDIEDALKYARRYPNPGYSYPSQSLKRLLREAELYKLSE
jgi:hypothetical protein